MKEKTVLLVDDEKKVLILLTDALEEEGFQVLSTTQPHQALKILQEDGVDAVVLDLVMPGIDGIEVLKKIKEQSPGIPVIMLSGHGTIPTAVESLKLGAYDFLEKPVSSGKISITLRNALTQSGLERDRSALLEKIGESIRMVGSSQAIKSIHEEIDKMAPTGLPVLITGESGTGKELVARALHLKSPRAARPFVPVNCSAIPANLMESELFGYEKGAFTDAQKDKPGFLEQADRGTLFLDEVSEMDMALQPKLLRVLETMEFQRLGGTSARQVDVRLVAATNRDLEKAAHDGAFREDLFYRLAVLTVHVPPLRERKEDIPLLAGHFAGEYCSKRKIPGITFSPAALEWLMDFPWPGNVRQLKHLVEKLAVLCEGQEIGPGDLEKHVHARGKAAPGSPAGNRETLEEARERAEKDRLLTKLHALDWDYKKVTSALGISRATLFNKLKKFGISKKAWK